MSSPPRPKKSLLIGINYTNSAHALRGCHSDIDNVADFLSYRGYSHETRSQVVLRDDRGGPYYPTGRNILAAMDWLVSEPGTTCFLHYSGHGGQVQDPSGQRPSGLIDSLVPVDFETQGQIDSDTLHRHLVTALHPSSTLFIVLDCCHSGSALELPFVYRSDEDGNVSMIDNVKMGMQLMGQAEHLMQGGFSLQDLGQAEQLFSGATSFFRSLKHQGGGGQGGAPGLQEDDWGNGNVGEQKMVTMFSGCRDDQTSADASIQGANVGAMSWAFLQTMRREPNPSYMQTLQETRQTLAESEYAQIPQLSVGVQMDLNQPLCL